MKLGQGVRQRLEAILASGSGDLRRPVIGADFQSNVPGLYVIGDLAGAPVIKLAMAQGYEVIEHIGALAEMARPSEQAGLLDVLVVGAGAAGLNAALAAQERGMSCLVLEKGKLANTIEDFPDGKWVYAEPDATLPKGKLWLDGAQKEDLVARWKSIVEDNDLDVHTEEPLVSLERLDDGGFEARTPVGCYRARKMVLATGQRGSPRRLEVSGEDQSRVYHRLYSPRKYEGERLLVVGGGNSAVEAALLLCERNEVTLSYRGEEFIRAFQDNRAKLDQAVSEGRVEVLRRSTVREFGDRQAALEVEGDASTEQRVVPFDHALVLIGADLPVSFLKSLGIRLENEWSGSLLRSTLLTVALLCSLALAGGSPGFTGWLGAAAALGALGGLVFTGWRGDRWSWLGVSFFVWYSVYGIKRGAGAEFWPYRDWGYDLLSFAGRGWSFWYTVIYTALMTGFGIKAMQRWGFRHSDRFQVLRFASLIAFQWIFFFLIPEFLFQLTVRFDWLPASLAQDPTFSEQGWRSYGIVYAWPLFFYTFFDDPHTVWVVWGVLLTFVIIPVSVLFLGKRYCSWVCGCGGLAETLGDRWRHLSPKGRESLRWESMGTVVLVVAFVVTGLKLAYDLWHLGYGVSSFSVRLYSVVVDVWLVGILPVTLYPFLGGKVWCRYWCPLAKMMEKMSWLYSRLGVSRSTITSNDKCIACNECSRNCQVGIDVMQYALKQEPLDNSNTSCIGCGICVTVCPMDTLKFGEQPDQALAK